MHTSKENSHEMPSPDIPANARLRVALYKFNAPPRRVPDRPGVVVREARLVEPIFNNTILFFARHYSGLATNTQRGIGQECGRLARVAYLKISRRAHAASIFLARNSSSVFPRGRLPGMMSHTSALDSMMRTFGSSEMGSKSLAESPVTKPLVPKWNGIPI